MTRVQWGKVGERNYEAGIDRGMLYVGNTGVAWSGLMSVKEGQDGGEAKAYYVDGVRYANRILLEEFQATIEAFTYPELFAQCDGTAQISSGLFATQQRRRPFGFSYRTLIGNDIEGLEAGYKIHIVYNAMAKPTSSRSYVSLGDKIDPLSFAWDIVTKPPVLDFVPTAHMIIDSRSTAPALLGQIEDILYGSAAADPRLPTAGELVFLFTSYANPDVLDDGFSDDPTYFTFDGGDSASSVTETFDGGTA